MRNLLIKEAKLSASPLAFWFMAFGLMFFLPGYPVLCGAFFTTLGLFQSFIYARECNDMVFSALLPIAKKDVVKARFVFVCLIELGGFLLMLLAALLRMTVFADALPYTGNALMNANFFALGLASVIFGIFNTVFVGSYFRDAYRLVKPFIVYGILTFLVIGLGEALHHFPGLDVLNAFGFDHFSSQVLFLVSGIIIYGIMTLLSYRTACRRFEQVDL